MNDAKDKLSLYYYFIMIQFLFLFRKRRKHIISVCNLEQSGKNERFFFLEKRQKIKLEAERERESRSQVNHKTEYNIHEHPSTGFSFIKTHKRSAIVSQSHSWAKKAGIEKYKIDYTLNMHLLRVAIYGMERT